MDGVCSVVRVGVKSRLRDHERVRASNTVTEVEERCWSSEVGNDIGSAVVHGELLTAKNTRATAIVTPGNLTSYISVSF